MLTDIIPQQDPYKLPSIEIISRQRQRGLFVVSRGQRTPSSCCLLQGMVAGYKDEIHSWLLAQSSSYHPALVHCNHVPARRVDCPQRWSVRELFATSHSPEKDWRRQFYRLGWILCSVHVLLFDWMLLPSGYTDKKHSIGHIRLANWLQRPYESFFRRRSIFGVFCGFFNFLPLRYLSWTWVLWRNLKLGWVHIRWNFAQLQREST